MAHVSACVSRQRGGEIDPKFDHVTRLTSMSQFEQHLDLTNLAPATESMFAAIIQGSADAIIALTADGVIIGWNPGAQDLFGYAEHEVIGAHVGRLIPPDRIGEEAAMLTRVLAGEKIAYYETERLHHDGDAIPVSLAIAPLRDSSGRVFGVSNIVRDISELSAARAHQRQLAAIVENTDDAIYAEDLDGTITSWNPAAERIYGYRAEQIVGSSVSRLIQPARRGEDFVLIERILNGERVEHFRSRRVRSDGELLDMSLTISPMLDERGAVIGASVIGRDVGTRERAPDTSDEPERPAPAAQPDSELLAMASRALRSPVATIAARARELRADGAEDSDLHCRQLLELVDDQATRMSTLVEQLLTVSSIDAGALRPRPSRVMVRGALERAAQECGHGAEISIDCPDELTAIADEGHLRQILLAFVANAVEHGEPPIELRALDGGGAVEVRVSDRGPGVPAAFVPRLFERFTQAVSADDPVARTGLGLAIARGLAQAQGGQAWYEPRDPAGSSFCIRLPLG